MTVPSGGRRASSAADRAVTCWGHFARPPVNPKYGTGPKGVLLCIRSSFHAPRHQVAKPRCGSGGVSPRARTLRSAFDALQCRVQRAPHRVMSTHHQVRYR